MGGRWLGVGVVSVVSLGLIYACSGFPQPPGGNGEDGGGNHLVGPSPDSGTPKPDAGKPPPRPDAGAPDAGGPIGAGPWPTDAVKNYSSAYQLGSIQSAGLDDGFNLWVLSGGRIGVLRPGDAAPAWSENLGQAALGFPSSVICG